MEEDQLLLPYRVNQLEIAVKSLISGQSDMRDFVIAIKVWMRVIAAIWSILALTLVGVLIKLLVG